jgi:hypothetical protein
VIPATWHDMGTDHDVLVVGFVSEGRPMAVVVEPPSGALRLVRLAEVEISLPREDRDDLGRELFRRASIYTPVASTSNASVHRAGQS